MRKKRMYPLKKEKDPSVEEVCLLRKEEKELSVEKIEIRSRS